MIFKGGNSLGKDPFSMVLIWLLLKSIVLACGEASAKSPCFTVLMLLFVRTTSTRFWNWASLVGTYVKLFPLKTTPTIAFVTGTLFNNVSTPWSPNAKPEQLMETVTGGDATSPWVIEQVQGWTSSNGHWQMTGFRAKMSVFATSPHVGVPFAVETNDLYWLLTISHDSLPQVDGEQSNGSLKCLKNIQWKLLIISINGERCHTNRRGNYL